MAGILKVDKYQDFNGNDIMTSDGSGNLTLNNAAMKATPAFYAYLSSSQDITTNTLTKIQFDTELFDTDNTYDNSTNYRFTPGVAGKYVLTIQMLNTTGTDYDNFQVNIKKNDSQLVLGRGANFNADGIHFSTIVDANTTDYFEGFFYHTKGSDTAVAGGTSPHLSFFGAYKIIGA